MQIKTFVFNPFQVNTYLVYNNENKAIVIDPAMVTESEKEHFSNFISENKLEIQGVYYTHGHMDHIAGSKWICETFNVKVSGNIGDNHQIQTAVEHARSYGFNVEPAENITHQLNDGDTISLGNDTFEILSVPGHTQGGLAFVNHNEKVIFAGDSLFNSSIGRTDLPGGDYDTLINSVKTKLLSLNGDYTVFPGHGPSTNIAFEKANNPFLR